MFIVSAAVSLLSVLVIFQFFRRAAMDGKVSPLDTIIFLNKF